MTAKGKPVITQLRLRWPSADATWPSWKSQPCRADEAKVVYRRAPRIKEKGQGFFLHYGQGGGLIGQGRKKAAGRGVPTLGWSGSK
jgi:hypothetical protein